MREPMTTDAFPILLAGELDLARQVELKQLADAYFNSANADVEVDLSAVTFMDSTGLNFLLILRRYASQRGGTVSLLAPSARCLRLLELAAVPSFFAIRPAALREASTRAG